MGSSEESLQFYCYYFIFHILLWFNNYGQKVVDGELVLHCEIAQLILGCKWIAPWSLFATFMNVSAGIILHHNGHGIISFFYLSICQLFWWKMLHIIPYESFVKLYQPQSCNFLDSSFHSRWHASCFGPCLLLCFISIVKQINSNPASLPTVSHYEERRPDTNRNRTLKFPAHYWVCARNTNQLTRRTFNKCKLWANLAELSGLPVPYSFPPPHCSQTPETILGLTREGREMKIWQCPPSRSFLPLLYLFLFHTVSHLCSSLLPPPLPFFSPQSPLPCSLHAV